LGVPIFLLRVVPFRYKPVTGERTMPTRHLGRLQLSVILGSALLGWGMIALAVTQVADALN
jgi:hypothetical protein